MQNRNAGVDLLRCVSMGMVLVLHLMLNSGSLGAHTVFSPEYYTVWTLEILAYGAVDIFALISGYVGGGRGVRFSNLIYLWLTALVLGLTVTVFFRFTAPNSYVVLPGSRFSPWIQALCPLFTGTYWFLNAYFLMFLFLPVVNAGIAALSGRALLFVCAGLYLAVCGLNMAGYDDPLRVAHGYSAVWLLALYVFGAALKKTGFLHRAPKSLLLLGYFFFSALTLLSKHLLDVYTLQTRGVIERDDYLIRYVSPTVVAGAVCLTVFFARLWIGPRLKRVIFFLAPSAFSVYLIHDHVIFRTLVMQKTFAFFTKLTPLGLVGATVVSAAALYALCTAVDLVRRGLFRLLRVKQLLRSAEEKARRVARRAVKPRPEGSESL